MQRYEVTCDVPAPVAVHQALGHLRPVCHKGLEAFDEIGLRDGLPAGDQRLWSTSRRVEVNTGIGQLSQGHPGVEGMRRGEKGLPGLGFPVEVVALPALLDLVRPPL